MKIAIPIYVVVSLGSCVVDGFPSLVDTSALEATSNSLATPKESRGSLQRAIEKRQLFGSLTTPVNSIYLFTDSSQKCLTRE
jgi:hypothetical protein